MISAAGERGGYAYSVHIGGMQDADNVHLLPGSCSHLIRIQHCHICKAEREHNRGYIKGFKALCLLVESGQAFVSLLSGGVRRRLRLSAGAPRLTPPDYPPTVLMASQI